MDDLTILLIGGIVGIIGSSLGYLLNHLLNMRERKILREFDIRERGREFYHQIYGIVAVLSDLATSFLQNGDKNMVLVEKGYTILPQRDIIKKYREEYERFSKTWYESRGKGLEVFISRELASHLETFWGYAGYFYEKNEWNQDKETIRGFKEISQKICDELDKLLGLN